MEVIIRDGQKPQELNVGDIVKIVDDENYVNVYLCQELIEVSGYALVDLDGCHFTARRKTLQEIEEFLKTSPYVKSYEIYSQNDYRIVVEPKQDE
jgi:hypothetical protein